MANNISFSTLKLKREDNPVTIDLCGQKVEVKTYLPADQKIKIIENVLRNSADDYNFANPMKIAIWLTIEIIENYTNISFRKEEKENPSILYDILITNDFVMPIIEAIGIGEYNILESWLEKTIDAYYKYKNSAMGIMEAAALDANNLNFDLEEIKKEIANTDNFKVLQEISEKLD